VAGNALRVRSEYLAPRPVFRRGALCLPPIFLGEKIKGGRHLGRVDGYLDASELPPRSNSPLQPPVSLTFYLLNNFPHAPLPPSSLPPRSKGCILDAVKVEGVEAVGGGPPFALRFAVRSTVTDWSTRTKRVEEGAGRLWISVLRTEERAHTIRSPTSSASCSGRFAFSTLGRYEQQERCSSLVVVLRRSKMPGVA
jgi:hypothetical protein